MADADDRPRRQLASLRSVRRGRLRSRSAPNTAAFCEAYGYSLLDSANTIVVVGKSDPRRYAACVVLADSRLDVNGVVRKRLGARKASFAPGEETQTLTGMVSGGVTPFALPVDLPCGSCYASDGPGSGSSSGAGARTARCSRHRTR
ncbi:MAG: YbaK/EbsC family protein [Ilumatobacteraceae bacterium]